MSEAYTMRSAAYAGLDDEERGLVAGGTVRALVERGPVPAPSAPRVAETRLVNGRLLRVSGYIANAFGAMAGGGPPADPARGRQHIALARAACRDPEAGAVGPALVRIDETLAAVEQLIGDGGEAASRVFALMIAAGAVAATEPVGEAGASR